MRYATGPPTGRPRIAAAGQSLARTRSVRRDPCRSRARPRPRGATGTKTRDRSGSIDPRRCTPARLENEKTVDRLRIRCLAATSDSPATAAMRRMYPAARLRLPVRIHRRCPVRPMRHGIVGIATVTPAPHPRHMPRSRHRPCGFEDASHSRARLLCVPPCDPLGETVDGHVLELGAVAPHDRVAVLCISHVHSYT